LKKHEECAYAEQNLAPTFMLGGIVVLGNLSAHRVPGVPEANEAAGATPLYPRRVQKGASSPWRQI